MWSVAFVVVTRFICSITLYLGCIYASRSLHIMLLRNVLRSPATFFDITPIGRILNRFGKDVDILDETLPVNISTMLVMFFSVNTSCPLSGQCLSIFVVELYLFLSKVFGQVFFILIKFILRVVCVMYVNIVLSILMWILKLHIIFKTICSVVVSFIIERIKTISYF